MRRDRKASFSKDGSAQRRDSFLSAKVTKHGKLEKRSSGHVVRWQRRHFVVNLIGLSSHAVALAYTTSV
jgi:hypothetical protein